MVKKANVNLILQISNSGKVSQPKFFGIHVCF